MLHAPASGCQTRLWSGAWGSAFEVLRGTAVDTERHDPERLIAGVPREVQELEPSTSACIRDQA